MKSALRGRSTLEVEVTNASRHGFWLLLGERELFLPFEHFPWFEDTSIGQLLNVELLHPGHLYWPDLDVDLSVESIEHPERFPLLSRAPVDRRIQQAREPRRAQAGRRGASGPRERH